MTADLRPAADKVLSAAAERDAELVAELAAARPFKRRPWLVVRQFTHIDAEPVVSSHRLEVVAELAARLRAKRHRSETGGHYTVRKAAS
jgi:hypothetical protein